MAEKQEQPQSKPAAEAKEASLLDEVVAATPQTSRDAATDLVRALVQEASRGVVAWDKNVTRTIPISGKFSPSQADIYSVVLRAQLSAIEKIRCRNRYACPAEPCVSGSNQGAKSMNPVIARGI